MTNNGVDRGLLVVTVGLMLSCIASAGPPTASQLYKKAIEYRTAVTDARVSLLVSDDLSPLAPRKFERDIMLDGKKCRTDVNGQFRSAAVNGSFVTFVPGSPGIPGSDSAEVGEIPAQTGRGSLVFSPLLIGVRPALVGAMHLVGDVHFRPYAERPARVSRDTVNGIGCWRIVHRESPPDNRRSPVDDRRYVLWICEEQGFGLVQFESRARKDGDMKLDITYSADFKQYGGFWYPASTKYTSFHDGKPTRVETVSVKSAEFNAGVPPDLFKAKSFGFDVGQ